MLFLGVFLATRVQHMVENVFGAESEHILDAFSKSYLPPLLISAGLGHLNRLVPFDR